MTVNLKCFNLLGTCAAAAIILLAPGCGSDSPATAPVPQLQPQLQPQVQNVVVQLGSHGGSVTLAGTSGGGWALNGRPFSSNTELAGDNGLTYRLTLAGGMWTAEFVPPAPVSVDLGTSGEQASLHLQEDGSYTLDQTPVTQGRRVTASNGVEYELEQGPNGAWQASLAAGSETDPAPADPATAGPGPIAFGGVAPTAPVPPQPADPAPADPAPADPAPADPPADPAPADPEPAELEPVIGETVEVVATPTPTPADPPPLFSFRTVRRSTTVIYDLPWRALQTSGGQFDLAYALQHPRAVEVADIGFLGEAIDVAGNYSGRGRAELHTYVGAALELLDQILGPIDDGTVSEGSPESVELIEVYWDWMNSEFEWIFGSLPSGAIVPRPDTGVQGEALQLEVTQGFALLRELRTALGSPSSFTTYFSDYIALATARGVTAAQLYGETKRIVALGSTDTTRFGVGRIPIADDRFNHPTAIDVIADGLSSRSAAFAYSPLGLTLGGSMPTTGTATYNGHTWGISETAYEVFSGDISLSVDFAAQTLGATLSNLQAMDGSAIQINSTTDLDQIALPSAGVPTDGTGISQFEGSGSATYTYADSTTATATDWSWNGLFVSSDDTEAAGVLGNWSLDDQLTGAFGADLVP